MTERPGHVVDYGAFQHPTSPLFRDYLNGQAKALGFYGGGGWDLPAVLAASQQALTLERPREAVAAALVAQQQARGAPRAAARAELLRDARAGAGGTGQQAGLFGGPPYALYKALAAPKTARLLEERRGAPVAAAFWGASAEHSPTSRLAIEIGSALLAAGYHQQVPVRPGFLNLFLYFDGERRALAEHDGTVEVRGPGWRIPVAEAARLVGTDPASFSPGVLLRPLPQDALLPTAAYVGGPAQIAYHAQIGPSYAHFGIPRPVLLPRPSLTLVEPQQARALESQGLKLTDLEADPEGLVSRWAREAYPDVEAAFARAREALERELTVVEERLGALDPTLRAAADGARGRALHQIEALYEKSIRALKKRDQTRADRLRRSRAALFPGGSLQERGLSLVSALAPHGLGLMGDVEARMDPFARGHQVLYL